MGKSMENLQCHRIYIQHIWRYGSRFLTPISGCSIRVYLILSSWYETLRNETYWFHMWSVIVRLHQLRLTFENSHPAIAAGSQTTSYSSERLLGVPGDLMVLLREETPGFGKTSHPQGGHLLLVGKFPLVYNRNWLLVSSPNIGLLLEGPSSDKLVHNLTYHYWP